MFEPSEALTAGYDRLASRWDEWASAVRPELRTVHTARLAEELESGSRVVELGCGTGIPVGRALSSSFDYFGVDISPEMVRRAEKNCPDGRFQAIDMASVSLPSGSVTAMVAFYSIIHVAQEKQGGSPRHWQTSAPGFGWKAILTVSRSSRTRRCCVRSS